MNAMADVSDVPVYVVVGGGRAGASAVTAMREANFRGRILLVGAESYPPYERPPLSKEMLVKPEAAQLTIYPTTYYADKNIECRFAASVAGLDAGTHRLTLTSGEEFTFDKLLLATGARARAYPLLDQLGERVFTLRTRDDAERLHGALTPGRRLLVVGGGIIGLEVAASAIALGATVTVVERADRLMARGTPDPLVDILRRLHVENGVRFELEATLNEASCSNHSDVLLRAEDGRSFVGDLVVYGIGVELNTELAVSAGLRVENGIVIDEYGRTSQPAIYAAGDVVCQWNPATRHHQRFETWANAQSQGAAVGRSMVTGEPCSMEVPWYWTDQYGHNFQVAGSHEASEWLYRNTGGSLKTTMLGLVNDVVVGAVTIDNGREMRPIRTMIANRFKVTDRVLLADPKVDLRKLVECGH